jgi:hypothetical protein
MKRPRKTNQKHPQGQIRKRPQKRIRDQRDDNDKKSVEREKIRGQRYKNIRLCEFYTSSFSANFKIARTGAEKEPPERMRKLMTENVRPHRTRYRSPAKNEGRNPSKERNDLRTKGTRLPGDANCVNKNKQKRPAQRE